MVIKNIGDFITNNLQKIDGFDFRWSSLITSNPLLFEDINYLRIKPFIDNTITEDEIEAYKRGDLRDMYATIDNLLVCNLRYYDRIINYCTMIFLHYIEINGENYKEKQAKLENLPFELSLTPTKIWCAVLANQNSTEWELKYGWNVTQKLNTPIKISDKSIFELNWNILYKNPAFAKFNEWNSFRCNTNGFRETLIHDKTDNIKLSQVCAKFTKSSSAISEQQLDNIYNYYKNAFEINDKLHLILDKCLKTLFNGDSSCYSIYIFTSEFYIFSNKFTIRVSKTSKGIISKDYLANSYECFLAEEFLMPSIQMQIEWAKYSVPNTYDYDKSILKSLLLNLLDDNYRNIIAIKRTPVKGVVSKITFSGIFKMVKIREEFLIDNRVIKTQLKILSKANASKYLIDRGYILFGLENDILNLNGINKKSLIKHFNNYCIPVMNYMYDIITLHNNSKKDIIEVVVNGYINPGKLNNSEIKFSNITSADNKDILRKGLDYQNQNSLKNKKTYWKAVND